MASKSATSASLLSSRTKVYPEIERSGESGGERIPWTVAVSKATDSVYAALLTVADCARMPELPEVERAVGLIRSIATGKKIQKVDTVEDLIVFSGTSHSEFAAEITGRTVIGAGRYGKCFYIELDGEGRMPVLHFGMTGMLQIKGELPIHYREVPRKASIQWPPRFMKFILHLSDKSGVATELAFLDARRLGRVRLCASPLTEPPISTLGFDPILSMPSLEDFTKPVLKTTRPVKALLLDQSFSAGVGNWLADEILYHARIHPEQSSNTLTKDQLIALHHNIGEVCRIAVEANADASKFPDDWLFKHRWGKGKKGVQSLKLPSGEPATIKWLKVGGRTSAYIVELQHLSHRTKQVLTEDDNASEMSELTELSDLEGTYTKKRMNRISSKIPDKQAKQSAKSSFKKARNNS